jgi:hypothetical protein
MIRKIITSMISRRGVCHAATSHIVSGSEMSGSSAVAVSGADASPDRIVAPHHRSPTPKETRLALFGFDIL